LTLAILLNTAGEVVADLLITETKRVRKAKREKFDQESLRLVSITYKRKGHEYQVRGHEAHAHR
jgi:hypothetical protein